MIVYVFVCVLVILFALCFFFIILPTKKLNNDYTLTVMMGKKGCGKSTTIAKLVNKYNKLGWTCYSTTYCKGAYRCEVSDIGNFNLIDYKNDVDNPSKICLFVDEINLSWDNRDFKNFSSAMKDWLIQMRKYHIKCFMFSQTYSCDKKIRDLADEIWLLSKFFCFTYGRKVRKFLTIRDSANEDGSQVTEGMEFEKFFVPHSRMLTYIPHWCQNFDTDEKNKTLPDKTYTMW